MPDIKTKIKAEGGKEFKEVFAENSRELRVFQSELGKVDALYQDSGKSAEGLKTKNEVLGRTLETQKQQVSLLRAEYEKANTTYGESDRRTQRLAEQLNNAETAAIKTENAIKKNKEQLDGMNSSTIKVSDIVGQFAGKLGINLPEGASKSIDSMLSFDGATAAVVAGIGSAIAIIAKLEAELIKLTEEQGKKADSIETLSEKYGLSALEIQEFTYAAERADVSVDTLFSARTKLTKSISEARDGNKELQATFQDLGVEYVDHNGKLRDSQTVFWETVDALKGIENQTERDAISLKVFSRGAMELNPVIETGSKGFKEYIEVGRNLGVYMGEDMVRNLARVDDSVNDLNAQMNAGNNILADKFGPSTIKFNEQLGELMIKGTELLVDSGFIDLMGVILDIVSDTFPVIASTVDLLGPVSGVILKPIALMLAVIGDGLGLIVNLLALIIESVRWLITFGKGSYNFDKYIANGNDILSGGSTKRLINGYASGTDYHPGGAALVGEEGPEIALLPRGTKVIPHRQSMSLMRSTVPSYANGIGTFGGNVNYYITIDAKNVREFNDIVRIVEGRRVSVRQGYTGR